MIHVTYHSGVQVLSHGSLFLETDDLREIEHGRTVEIGLQGRCRKGGVLQDYDIFLSLGNIGTVLADLRLGLDETPFQIEVVMIFQLLDVAAFFAALQAFGPGVIDERHRLGPLDHPVEVICPDGILVFVGREAEAFTQLRRDERRAHAPAREYAFIA